MNNIYTTLLSSLTDFPVTEVRIGVNWTAVVIQKPSGLQCGLASTLTGPHHHTGEPTIPEPGHLAQKSGLQLASWIQSEIPLRRSVGCAALNALLTRNPAVWEDRNAEEEIFRHGKEKKVVLIGHFPFASRLKTILSQFQVLELNPVGDDLPASAAPQILPEADLVAVTGMTFLNHTLEKLLSFCRQDAFLLMLGPTTPLTPLMYDYGFDLLAGAVVEDIPAVLNAVCQGANFRQVHHAGVRLVTQSSNG